VIAETLNHLIIAGSEGEPYLWNIIWLP